MKEEEIYILLKRWLIKMKYYILAGQPPSGTDNIPVIEIKEPNNKIKGSKGSYKPDLVAINEKNLLIIECKPSYNFNDEKKLENVLFGTQRKKLLYKEINQRNLFEKSGHYHNYKTFELMNKKLKFCLANSSTIKLKNISNIKISSNCNDCKIISPLNSEFKIN